MTGTSSVGPISVNGAGDQRNVKNSELEHAERYEEGKVNSHNTDDPSKTLFPCLDSSVKSILTKITEDQRSIANRLAAEEKKDDEPKDDKETALSKKDPTLPVCLSQRHAWDSKTYR